MRDRHRRSARSTSRSIQRSRPRAAPPPGGAGSRRLLRVGALALLAAAVLLTFFGWLALSRRPGPPTTPEARLSAEEAFAAGVELAMAKRHQASLPYFRRAVSQAPDSWTAHANYSNALHNGAQESRRHLGKDEAAARSSVERIGMMRECLRESDLADSLTAAPAERATIAYQRAQSLQTWGFPIEAWLECRRAQAMDSMTAEIGKAARATGDLLAAGGRAER
jgi:hypothetical protein